MVRRRKEEFKSNQPIWPHCPKCLWYFSFHIQKPISPTSQAPFEDPTTMSRFQLINKWFLFSPIFCEYDPAFSARNLHSEPSGTGQIISDSCSEMQDLVTCSTIKLPWASSSLFLIFVQTPPLLHRQQPIFRVLPLHREQEYQTYVPTKTAPQLVKYQLISSTKDFSRLPHLLCFSRQTENYHTNLPTHLLGYVKNSKTPQSFGNQNDKMQEDHKQISSQHLEAGVGLLCLSLLCHLLETKCSKFCIMQL